MEKLRTEFYEVRKECLRLSKGLYYRPCDEELKRKYEQARNELNKLREQRYSK